SLYYSFAAHRYLPSFPTRRSSDLFDLLVATGNWHIPLMAFVPPPRTSHRGWPTPPISCRSQFKKPAYPSRGRLFCCAPGVVRGRSEEHTSELQSRENLVCRLLLEK